MKRENAWQRSISFVEQLCKNWHLTKNQLVCCYVELMHEGAGRLDK